MGIHPIILGLIGQPDEIEMLQNGQGVKKGETLLKIHKGERVLDVVAPINGTITGLNNRVIDDSTVVPSGVRPATSTAEGVVTMLPPITESADHPDVCEDHGSWLQWYDDGSIESDPIPYQECPECREEEQHPLLTCDVCGKQGRVVRTSLISANFGPTIVSHMPCGHVII